MLPDRGRRQEGGVNSVLQHLARLSPKSSGVADFHVLNAV